MSSWHGTELTEAQYLEWASARYGRGNCHVMLLSCGNVIFSDSSRQHPVRLHEEIADQLHTLLRSAREAQQRDLTLRQQETTIPINLANEIGDINL